MFVNSWEFCELFKNACFVEGLQRAGSETTVRGTFFAEHHLGRNGGGGAAGGGGIGLALWPDITAQHIVNKKSSYWLSCQTVKPSLNDIIVLFVG